MSEIMLDVLHPVHPVIKQYVDYYYILNPKKDYLNNSYTAYPTINQPVVFFEHTDVLVNANHHHLKFNGKASGLCGVLNRFTEPLEVTVTGKVRTINIVFKNLGLNAFLKVPYASIIKTIFQKFNAWDTDASFIANLFFLPGLQLAHSLDQMLLNNYTPFVNEHLVNAIDLMRCEDSNYEVQEIEHRLSVSRKTLLRLFKTNTGISPTSFRRIIRFRQALENNKSQPLSLTQLAYVANFADQSHFIKELHKLTRDKPSTFLKSATYVKGSKLLIKQHL